MSWSISIFLCKFVQSSDVTEWCDEVELVSTPQLITFLQPHVPKWFIPFIPLQFNNDDYNFVFK